MSECAKLREALKQCVSVEHGWHGNPENHTLNATIFFGEFDPRDILDAAKPRGLSWQLPDALIDRLLAQCGPGEAVKALEQRAAEAGLDADAVDGFSCMERDDLIVQAALWRRMAIAHQNNHLAAEMRLGKAVQDLLDLCRENGVEVPDKIVDAMMEKG